ncbi:MAG: ABC transporter ATP-binding protein, partial [Burkholderiales bacterium]|nr:ABC transporter ATP-binding protein [Anaerolineae bacterium]
MGFIMDGLDAEAYDREYTDGALVKRIISYFRPQLGRMIVVALAVFLSSLVNTLMPIYISASLDQMQVDPTSVNLVLVAVVLVILGVLAWVFNAARQWLTAEAVGNVVLNLRTDAFNAVVERDLSFYDTFASGKVVSRVTSDTQAFAQVVTLTIDLISQLLMVVLLIGYLFVVNVPLTVVLLGIAPFIVFVALMFRKIARVTITQSRRIRAIVTSNVQETVSGISVAKTFRQEGTIFEEFEKVNQQAY